MVKLNRANTECYKWTNIAFIYHYMKYPILAKFRKEVLYHKIMNNKSTSYHVLPGAFKDKQILTADNYASMQDRQWRGSYMVPFAANVAVVKYK